MENEKWIYLIIVIGVILLLLVKHYKTGMLIFLQEQDVRTFTTKDLIKYQKKLYSMRCSWTKFLLNLDFYTDSVVDSLLVKIEEELETRARSRDD